MSELIRPGSIPESPLQRACERIDFLSEQLNYLLRELFKSTNGQHGCFRRNTRLAEDTRRAIDLMELDRTREVKVVVPTPEFTREQIKKLNSEMGK